MQIVVGIDASGKDDALKLVKRMRFTTPSFDLTQVIPPSPWSPTGVYGGLALEASITYEDFQAMENAETEQARSMLINTAAMVQSEDGNSSISVLHGYPPDQLMTHADKVHADLVAVNAPHEGPLLAYLTGSVSRALVIGASQSVLLARGCGAADSTDKSVRAVLATDHSPYMERCIEEFLRFRPRGLEELTILTAYPGADMEALTAYMFHLSVKPADALRADLERRNDALAQYLQEKLAPLPVKIRSVVSSEPVNRAIENTMEETHSDLLVLGAQGHSFLQRLTLGSVSFRETMTAPYSVLVLRTNKPTTH